MRNELNYLTLFLARNVTVFLYKSNGTVLRWRTTRKHNAARNPLSNSLDECVVLTTAVGTTDVFRLAVEDVSALLQLRSDVIFCSANLNRIVVPNPPAQLARKLPFRCIRVTMTMFRLQMANEPVVLVADVDGQIQLREMGAYRDRFDLSAFSKSENS